SNDSTALVMRRPAIRLCCHDSPTCHTPIRRGRDWPNSAATTRCGGRPATESPPSPTNARRDTMRDSVFLKRLGMAKGLFTQGICLLLERPIDSAQIESVLSGFEIVGRHE